MLEKPIRNWRKSFVLLQRLKKKDAPGEFYKYSTENETF